jgi:hypothetical protein
VVIFKGMIKPRNIFWSCVFLVLLGLNLLQAAYFLLDRGITATDSEISFKRLLEHEETSERILNALLPKVSAIEFRHIAKKLKQRYPDLDVTEYETSEMSIGSLMFSLKGDSVRLKDSEETSTH